MQAVQAQHLAAHVVNLEDTSFSAANANVGAVVYDSDFIALDIDSTLEEEAEAALQLVEDKRKAEWEMLLEQDSSWPQSTSQKEDISYLWHTNVLGVFVQQRLNFDVPINAFDDGSAENAQACMSDTASSLDYDTNCSRGKFTMTTRDTVTTSVSSAPASTSHHTTYAFSECTVEAL